MLAPAVCQQCGGPRHPHSGKRCRKCYRENSALRKSGTPEGQVLNALLYMERMGEVEQTPEGWQAVAPFCSLSEFDTDDLEEKRKPLFVPLTPLGTVEMLSVKVTPWG
jgi:ribosomal protein L40E